MDLSSGFAGPSDGYQRIMTALMYLTHVEEGGETSFPVGLPTVEFAARHAGEPRTDCGGEMSQAAVRPTKGTALVFHSVLPSFGIEGDRTETDSNSLHAGCPVVAGTKWSATKWIRQECHSSCRD